MAIAVKDVAGKRDIQEVVKLAIVVVGRLAAVGFHTEGGVRAGRQINRGADRLIMAQRNSSE